MMVLGKVTADLDALWQRRRPRHCSKRLDTSAPFELACIVLSAAALGMVVCILQLCDGKPQPTFSLNTAISVLAMYAKTCIIGLLGGGIGQLKWIWFSHQPRALKDIETFDSASRGEFLANCKLPILQRFRSIATLGCIAFLLGVGFEPFMQNLVRYETQQIPDTTKTAKIANSTVYSAAGPILTKLYETVPQYSVDPALKANVYSSVFSSDPSKPWAVPKYTCSSGDCSWSKIETLGVRALCSDLTDRIYRDCAGGYCSARIDGGPLLFFLEDEQYAGMLVINVTNTATGIIYKNATLPVVQYIMVKDGGSQTSSNPFGLGPDQPLVAAECSFEVCILSSQSRISDGIYQESDMTYWCHLSSNQSNRNITLAPSQDISLQNRVGGQRFGLSYTALQSITWFLQGIFDSSLEADKTDTWYVRSQIESLYAPVDIGQSIFYGNFSHCPDTDDHLSCVAQNVALAMSKSFRDSAYIAKGLDEADMTIGRTMVAVTVVRIDWSWLALPLLVWLLSVVLWLTAAWQTRKKRLPLWRNSLMPLFHLWRKVDDKTSHVSRRQSINVKEEVSRDDSVQLYLTANDAYLA